ALGFAAGDRRRRLTEPDVSEPDVAERLELATEARDALKELVRFVYGHIEHVRDTLALIRDVERLAAVALALADFAGDGHVREEVHLDLDVSVAGARLAAAALHIEREAAGRVAAQPRFGHAREQLADR